MQRTSIELQTAITRRSQRMYGMPLPADQVINVGIGPFVDMHDGSTVDALPPTRVFDDTLEDTVAGIHFKLVHAPGETDDRSDEHTSELQSLMRISYSVFCMKKKNQPH